MSDILASDEDNRRSVGATEDLYTDGDSGGGVAWTGKQRAKEP
jgi:hypothetical protein